MQVYRLLQKSGYGEEEVRALSDAFESVCLELRLAQKDDVLRDFVAGKILEVAARGERDPVRIVVIVLEELQGRG